VINLRAVTNQTVGQPLTLECNATAVRGITSSVDITIFSLGPSQFLIVETFEDVDPIIVGNSAVYSADVTLTGLTSFDNGRLIICSVNINSTSRGTDALILSLQGTSTHIHMYTYTHIHTMHMHTLLHLIPYK